MQYEMKTNQFAWTITLSTHQSLVYLKYLDRPHSRLFWALTTDNRV